MSFNETCGPSNGLQQLSKHVQQDRSLHQDARLAGNQSQHGSFRTLTHNPQLEREFHQQFAQNNPNVFASAFGGAQHLPAQHSGAGAVQGGSPGAQGAHKQGWVHEFSNLGLNDKQKAQQGPAWSTQFAQQAHQQAPAALGAPGGASHQLYSPRLQAQFGLNAQTAGTARLTEHQQLHRHELNEMHFQNQLELQFAEIDRELETELKDGMEMDTNLNKEKFAEAAREIVSAMSTADNPKFKNSKFLNLMEMVSNRDIELSNDETKLVDRNGDEVKSTETDIDTNDTANRLPDPLANIGEGELHTPFQSASLVSERNKDEKYSWDEVYDDYRNDDTSF